MTTPDHHSLLLAAHKAAHDTLCHYFQAAFAGAGLHPWTEDNTTELLGVVESCGEAGYQQVMLKLTRQKRKNDCDLARETLREVVASSIASGLLTTADLKNVFTEAAANGERAYQLYIIAPQQEGGVERLEAELFRGWQRRVREFRGKDGEAGDPATVRGALVLEIHENCADRHPLGIARTLAEVITALACEEADADAEAIDLFDYLAIAEERAAAFKSGEGPPLGEGGTIFDVDIDLSGMPDAPIGSSDAVHVGEQLNEWLGAKTNEELLAVAKHPDAAPPWVQVAADAALTKRSSIEVQDTVGVSDAIETEVTS